MRANHIALNQCNRLKNVSPLTKRVAVVTLLAQIEVNLPLSFFTSRSDLIYLRLEGDLLKIELGALRQTD